jgi:hypothetical protein
MFILGNTLAHVEKRANHLFIGLDKETFHPGKPISGILFIYIANEDALKQAKSIELRWEGW